MRLGALARLVEQDLPDRRPDLPVAGHRLGLRARGAVVDGEERELTPTSIVLLRLLSREPGAVVSREDLLAALGGDDPHAVEAAVARL
ncbi:winged helix-turn-helix domain-containing protein, partial [Mycobacterium kansasii]